MCAFLGMQSHRIGKILALEGGCIPLYLVNVPFRDSYCIFWHFLLKFLYKNAKLRIKKKKADPYFSIFWVGRKRANKNLFGGPLHRKICILSKLFKNLTFMHLHKNHFESTPMNKWQYLNVKPTFLPTHFVNKSIMVFWQNSWAFK